MKFSSKSGIYTVEGPRGKLTKSYKHIKCNVSTVDDTDKLTGKKHRAVELVMYLNTYKQAACLNTLAGHIKNMFIGVTDGFRYKMHTVDKHFSIEMEIKGQTVLIKRFLGENDVKVVKLVEGVKASLVGKDQDEIWFEGIDVDSVSLNCGFLTRLARSSQR